MCQGRLIQTKFDKIKVLISLSKILNSFYPKIIFKIHKSFFVGWVLLVNWVVERKELNKRKITFFIVVWKMLGVYKKKGISD